MSREWRFTVRGEPKPKGSMKAFVVRHGPHAGRAVMTSAKSANDWQKLVSFQAQQFDGAPMEGPIALTLTFHLPRPKSAPRRITLPAKKPDIDKLSRSVLDALSGIVFRDDAQVVELTARKLFATEFAGLEVYVREINGTE